MEQDVEKRKKAIEAWEALTRAKDKKAEEKRLGDNKGEHLAGCQTGYPPEEGEMKWD